MKHLKKILAAVLSVVLVLSFCACEFHEKNELVATVGKTPIGSELYIMYLMQADTEFKGKIDDSIKAANGTAISNTADYYEKTLDGKDSDQWLADKTMMYLKEYAWTVETFESLGLTLNEEQKQAVDSYVYTYWDYYGNSVQYESYGISEDAFRLYWEQLVKKEAIFNYYYDEKGIQEVSKDDIFKNITENYIQAETITIGIVDEKGAKLTGEKLAAEQNKAKDYVDRFNKGEATIGKLNEEYSGKTTSSTTSTTASTQSATSALATSSAAVSSGATEDEEIKSKYADAMFFNSEDQDTTVYDKLKEIIAKDDFVGYDKAAYFETDTSIVVYVVRDMSTDKEFVMDQYKVTALHNLKDTDFTKIISDALAKLTVAAESTIGRYRATNFLTEEE